MAREYHLDFFSFTPSRRSEWELAKFALRQTPGFDNLSDDTKEHRIRRLTGKFKKRKDEFVFRATDPDVEAWRERINQVHELLRQLGILTPNPRTVKTR